MKKIVSLILAGLMSVSLFAIGASAETIAPNTQKTVVGSSTGGTYQGVDSFNNTSNDSQINVKVEKVVHKYAVDLTFKFDDFTIGGATWNVDTMRYDIDKNKLPESGDRTIQIDNRSDLPVYATATLSNATAAENRITLAVQYPDAPTNKLTVAAATAGTGAAGTGEAKDGTAGTGKILVNVSATDWQDVANYYIRQMETKNLTTGQTFTIATITVTISKD